MSIKSTAKQAKSASVYMSALDAEDKNNALKELAESLDKQRAAIVEANKEDLEEAVKNELAPPLLKRLKFDSNKIDNVIKGINSLIALPEPVGQTLRAMEMDKGLELYKVTCPIGVIGMIFESRPDALVQIATLCLKSGNSVLLKGGSEASRTNRILVDVIANASKSAGLPDGWINLLETRAEVKEMLALDEEIDLIVPRGSNEFVKYIMDNSNIPVLGHADGICHVYVDAAADTNMAEKVVADSKCQYVAVCNALETLLVHESVAEDFLPKLKSSLDIENVVLFGCEKTQKIIDVNAASEEDWATEYLDYTLSIKVVKDMDEAIQHINKYGSGHTDAIVTASKSNAHRFMDLVDSGNVFWNCSTRFSDGYRYGLGAEVGMRNSENPTGTSIINNYL
jgi:glutamate-5-semialdehyde dehydrogenase